MALEQDCSDRQDNDQGKNLEVFHLAAGNLCHTVYSTSFVFFKGGKKYAKNLLKKFPL